MTYQLLLVTNFSDKLVAPAVEFRSLPYLRDVLVYHNYNLSGPLHALYILYTRQSGPRLPGPMPGTIYQGMPWKLLAVERPLGKFAMVSCEPLYFRPEVARGAYLHRREIYFDMRYFPAYFHLWF